MAHTLPMKQVRIRTCRDRKQQDLGLSYGKAKEMTVYIRFY